MDKQVGVPNQLKASSSNSILSPSPLDEFKEYKPKSNVDKSN